MSQASLRKQQQHKPLSHWLNDHARAAIQCLGHCARRPFSTGLTIGVITIALALPASFYLFFQNVQSLAPHWKQQKQMSLYLKTNLSEAQINAFQKRLAAREDIAKTVLITPDEGLAQLSQQTGFEKAFEALPKNPLPTVINVTPTFNHSDLSAMQNMHDTLQTMPQVELAQFDRLWIARLGALMTVGRQVSHWLLLFFAGAVLLVINQSVRMTLQQHAAEIRIIQLFGGTPAFIARPFLYRGLLLGATSGITAWLLIDTLTWTLSRTLHPLLQLFESQWTMQYLGLRAGFNLTILGGVLGLIAAWSAMRRQHARN